MHTLGRHLLVALSLTMTTWQVPTLCAQQSVTAYTLKPTPKTVVWGYYDAKTPPVLPLSDQ